MCICLDYVRLVTPNAISNAIPCVNPRNPENSQSNVVKREKKSSEEHLAGILGGAFVRAVGALKPIALAESTQRLLGNDVPTWHHHRGVLIGCLFLGNRADKDRVEQVGRWERDLNLRMG